MRYVIQVSYLRIFEPGLFVKYNTTRYISTAVLNNLTLSLRRYITVSSKHTEFHTTLSYTFSISIAEL